MAVALAGSVAIEATGRAAPPGQRVVAYPMKVAGRGSAVRLRRVFVPGLPPLPGQPLMPKEELLSQGNYDDIQWYVREILTKYPPDRYYYVGVGRTPSAIIAMLKNLGP